MAETEMMKIGDNVVATLEGDKLTVEVDMSKDLGLSKTGRTRLVATTRGSVKLADTGASIGLNIYRALR